MAVELPLTREALLAPGTEVSLPSELAEESLVLLLGLLCELRV